MVSKADIGLPLYDLVQISAFSGENYPDRYSVSRDTVEQHMSGRLIGLKFNFSNITQLFSLVERYLSLEIRSFSFF